MPRESTPASKTRCAFLLPPLIGAPNSHSFGLGSGYGDTDSVDVCRTDDYSMVACDCTKLRGIGFRRFGEDNRDGRIAEFPERADRGSDDRARTAYRTQARSTRAVNTTNAIGA